MGVNFSQPQSNAIHLLGIGGTGMSSLALHLHHEGHRVSGTDRSESGSVQLLRRSGIDVSLDESVLPEAVDRLVNDLQQQ